jgi:hypothetical protein
MAVGERGSQATPIARDRAQAHSWHVFAPGRRGRGASGPPGGGEGLHLSCCCCCEARQDGRQRRSVRLKRTSCTAAVQFVHGAGRGTRQTAATPAAGGAGVCWGGAPTARPTARGWAEATLRSWKNAVLRQSTGLQGWSTTAGRGRRGRKQNTGAGGTDAGASLGSTPHCAAPTDIDGSEKQHTAVQRA